MVRNFMNNIFNIVTFKSIYDTDRNTNPRVSKHEATPIYLKRHHGWTPGRQDRIDLPNYHNWLGIRHKRWYPETHRDLIRKQSQLVVCLVSCRQMREIWDSEKQTIVRGAEPLQAREFANLNIMTRM